MKTPKPSLTLLTLIAALGVSALSAAADTIQVPQEYPTIQAALNAAAPGDTVQVAAGIYTENIIWPDTNGIRLVGAGRDDTVIDGGDASSVIRFETADLIDAATIIEGFTIRNGNALPPWPESEGGGIFLYYSDPTLVDLTVTENFADDFGGGIYSWQSDPTLIRVVIAHNAAISRGGFVCDGGDPISTT